MIIYAGTLALCANSRFKAQDARQKGGSSADGDLREKIGGQVETAALSSKLKDKGQPPVESHSSGSAMGNSRGQAELKV